MQEKIKAYIDSKRFLWSPTTQKTAASILRRISFLELTEPADLFKKLKQEDYGLYAIKQYLIVWAGFEAYLSRGKTSKTARFLKENAFAFRNAYKEKTRKIESAEVEALLKSLEEKPGLFNIIYLMAYCGLRRSEALTARWADINGSFLTVRGKGDKQRHVPVERSALKLVEGERIGGTCEGFHSLIKTLRKTLTPHDLRSFYATSICQLPGVTLWGAAKVLGHSSILTTQKYLRVDQNKEAATILGSLKPCLS
jgi:integrase